MKNLTEAEFKIRGADGETEASVVFKNDGVSKPLIIASHGFMSWKDWGFFPEASRRLAERGAIVSRHNFSNSGANGGRGINFEVEKFSRLTVSNAIKDLEAITSFFENGAVGVGEALKDWNGEIYFWGHSLGAAVSLIYGARSGKAEKIACWAGVGKVDRYSPRQKEEWRRKGYWEYTDRRTGLKLRTLVDYLEDIESKAEEYDLARAIENFGKEVLILSGKADATVKTKEIRETLLRLSESARKRVRLVEIENCDHFFGWRESELKSEKAFGKAIEETANFFNLR